MTAVQCVSIPNRHGLKLHGILHAPDPDMARGECILLLSPGVKGRVAPHRLYLQMAERLVPLGFHVLRFDFHGLGDSEGSIDERVMADMYNSIQGGRYVDDTIDAMDWMQASHGVARFVGSGLCGGSITALLAARHDARIGSLLGLSLPSTLEGGAENFDRFLTRGQLRDEGRSYLRRIKDPRSWARFMTGKSGYTVILKALRELVFPTKSRPVATGSTASASSGPAAPVDNANPRFAPAFLDLLADRRPILLLFSGNDRHRHEFAEKFEDRYAAQIQASSGSYSLHVIDKANHILSDKAWVEEMLDVATGWLESGRDSGRS